MASVEQSPTELVEVIKAVGPYLVAILATVFAYVQSRKSNQTIENVAEINKNKDIELHKMQALINEKQDKSKHVEFIFKELEKCYSPLYGKMESLMHSYKGVITDNRNATQVKPDLIKLVVDDYSAFKPEYRKQVLAKSIALCQLLEDHKAYEIACNFDFKITEALSMFDFEGLSTGEIHCNELSRVQKEYSLLYVSFFYRVANKKNS